MELPTGYHQMTLMEQLSKYELETAKKDLLEYCDMIGITEVTSWMLIDNYHTAEQIQSLVKREDEINLSTGEVVSLIKLIDRVRDNQ